MRILPDNFDPDAVAEIDRRLEVITSDERVIIPLAIESGSRAWGFPSPDSDYDCRFVFVRHPEDTITLFPKRDVIETPLTPIIDVNGWELSKALRLMLAGNAVILEWLTSPIVYQVDNDFRSEFLKLASEVCDRAAIHRHYFHLARNQMQRLIVDRENVAVKKLFYALRPVMVLRWMRLHSNAAIAPMHFPTLYEEADINKELSAIIDDLLERKAVTRELGRDRAPESVLKFLEDELLIAEEELRRTDKRFHIDKTLQDRVNIFWKRWLSILNKENRISV